MKTWVVMMSTVALTLFDGGALIAKDRHESKLDISLDAAGNVVLSWNGKGVLSELRGKNGHYKKIARTSPYIVSPTDEQVSYRLESTTGAVHSQNVVGYVNMSIAPGLSLAANPLYYTNDTLAFWIPSAPDGTQVYKYTAANGYEVTTYDALDQVWSNPDMRVPIGEGFFLSNPGNGYTVTFIGELLQGSLTNNLPAGISTKGSLVPQGQTLSQHGIPGEPGDEIRIYTNDGTGNGAYNISVYTSPGVWVPDLYLGIGQGFWITKDNPQDWVRIFWAN